MNIIKKSVLIIGVSGGIGHDIAKKFLNNGFVVFGIGRSQEIPNDIKKNKNFIYQCVDITNVDQVSNFFQQSNIHFQFIVNCAGILRLKNSEQAGIDDWQTTIAVNLTGSFYIAKFASQYFRNKNMRGTIVFIGSRWGSSGTEKDCSYAASKSGLRGLVKSLQKESFSTGIRYILVSPGSVFTDMSRSVDSDVNDNILQPYDIADLIFYISSTSSNVIFDEISIKAFPYDYINF